MIVLDEHLHDPVIMSGISAWFPGRAIPLIKLRPGSLIKDEVIPALLRKLVEPTFVTINVTDFWKKNPSAFICCSGKMRRIHKNGND